MSSQPGSSTDPSLRGDEREQPVARDDVVDQLHRALLADRERRHRLREDDRLLQRQHRQRSRKLELLLLRLRNIEADLRHARSTVIRKRPAGGACSTTGSSIVSTPCSKRASACCGSTSSSETDVPLERPVLDLDLLVDAPRDLRAFSLACDHEEPLARDDADRLRVHAGELHDHRQRVRLVGVEAVDVRAKAVAEAGEPRHLPEIREQLLDLLLQLVDVPACHPARTVPRPAVRDRLVCLSDPRQTMSPWRSCTRAGPPGAFSSTRAA